MVVGVVVVIWPWEVVVVLLDVVVGVGVVEEREVVVDGAWLPGMHW